MLRSSGIQCWDLPACAVRLPEPSQLIVAAMLVSIAVRKLI